ncbi:MAG: hypothetical protein IJX52_00485, partial [Oscillibacter sp.]|nr:hypothetical protein [Oscillibacter sp.]
MNGAFLAEQAGLLAQTLEEGQPCPVCGSVHHPAPAKLSAEAPSEAALKDAKAAAEQAQSAAASASAKAGELKGTLEARRDGLARQMAELDCTERTLHALLEAVKTKLRELDTALLKSGEALKRKAALDTAVPRQEAAAAQAENTRHGLDTAIALGTAKVKELEGQRTAMHLRFPEKQAAEAAIQVKTSALGAMKDALAKAEQDYRKSRDALTSLEGKLAQLKELITGTEVPEAEQETAKKAELLEKKAAALSVRTELHTRLETNLRAYECISVKQKDITELENQWIWVKTLSNTANGNLTGKEKV